MKRAFPWDEQLDMSSESDEPSSSHSEMETSNGCDANKPLSEIAKSLHARAKMSEELLIRRAKMYQEYMKQIQVPIRRGSVIPCNSWMELGRSLKQLYDQPLHYLTNTFLKQWDQLRIGTGDEHKPLDNIIHPCKAETIIWLMEEVHRKTSSHLYLAQLWKADPMHQAFVDSVFPSLEHLY